MCKTQCEKWNKENLLNQRERRKKGEIIENRKSLKYSKHKTNVFIIIKI